MEDLVKWLRDALDDDERLARAAAGSDDGWLFQTPESPAEEHIARFAPARVQADVDAKRRILDRYEDACERVRNPVSADSRAAARVGQFELENVVRLLAVPYANRDGYREEWKP